MASGHRNLVLTSGADNPAPSYRNVYRRRLLNIELQI